MRKKSSAPDDGRKHRPKRVELTWNNKLLTIYIKTVSTHSRHQLVATWVNTKRYFKYSQVLLMMGEKIALNK